MINIPAKIFTESFFENICTLGAIHGDMVLKSVLTEKIEKLLKLRDFTNTNTTISSNRVICKFTFTDVGLYATLSIVGADT